MADFSSETLAQLYALNNWLGAVFGEGIRFSDLLIDTNFDETQIETLKQEHLTAFVQAVVDLIANHTANHDGERRNSVMVRYYGLLNGKPETLQSIGDNLNLSRERIRQLVQKRIRLYSVTKHKEQFRVDIASIAQRLLSKEVE